MRTARTRTLATFAVVVLVLVLGVALLYAVRSQMPPVAVTSSAAPTPTAIATTAVPTATASAAVPSKSIRATAVASIPREFAYVDASPGRDVTLWLVDLSGATPPSAVARWTLGNHTFAASRDGKTVIIAAPGDRSITALHLLHPLSGEATVLFEGPPDGRVLYQQLSPDGKRFAFTLGRNFGDDGVWVGEVATGAVRQVVPPHSLLEGGPTALLGWSDDSVWLTYGAYNPAYAGQGAYLYAQNVVDGRRIEVGPGHAASWRARESRIVGAVGTGKGDQGAFGAAVYTLDVAQGRRTELFSIDPRLVTLAWNPVKDEFLFLADTTGCNFHSTIWARSTSAADAKRIGTLQNAQDAWWSSDGETIYALVPGVGTDGAVVNAASGQRVATIPEAGPVRACP